MNKILIKLKQISYYCAQHDEYCNNCDLYTETGETICRIQNAIQYMSKLNPDEWDIEEVKKILNG